MYVCSRRIYKHVCMVCVYIYIHTQIHMGSLGTCAGVYETASVRTNTPDVRFRRPPDLPGLWCVGLSHSRAFHVEIPKVSSLASQ